MLLPIDSSMPFLENALSSASMHPHFEKVFGTEITVTKAKLVRHKAAKRCLIEYQLNMFQNDHWQAKSILAKARAKGLDKRSFELQTKLWESGFSDASRDCISVPHPIAYIAELNMWFQEKVSGVELGVLLDTPNFPVLMTHVAEALVKLHQSNIIVKREHSITDEMAILTDRIERVASTQASWRLRLFKLLRRLERLVLDLPEVEPSLIHRDFYQDQVLFSGSSIYLLDFDLAAMGDPALDVGNFLAHLDELGLRKGNIRLFEKEQQTFLESYLIRGTARRSSIEVYRLLTLARHIYISTLFPDREATTHELLNYLEKKLF